MENEIITNLFMIYIAEKTFKILIFVAINLLLGSLV